MKKLVFILITFALVVSCRTANIKNGSSVSEHFLLDDYGSFPTVFLNPDYNGIVQLVNNNKVIPLQNNALDGNFILFSLIKKAKDLYEVIAWNSSDESFIGRGKIQSDAPICIYSRQYIPEEDPLKLYANPNRDSLFVSDSIYRTEAFDVVDFCNKWLQVKLIIDNKIHIGWLPPEMQCSNVYSTCN